MAAIPSFLLLFIGVIAVALFIFHTNRKLYNDHSKSKRSPKRPTIHTTTPTARFKSADTPPTATTSKMSEGKAKGQGD